jgi:ribosomal protein S12 methylthiotransferase
MKKKKINITTLGCSKNLVDSEYLHRQLSEHGFQIAHNDGKIACDVAIINTCGFIQDAKEESIDVILDHLEAKEAGIIDKVFVMGCLSERYKQDLRNEMSQVDDFFGVNDLPQIIEKLGVAYKKELLNERITATPKHLSYLKISEGCSRRCAFCAIPIIRGAHQSKPINDLLQEAEYLSNQGTKELILIAQDLSFYGLDLYKSQKLTELVEKLSKVDGLKWIRLHYLYPDQFPLSLIPLMRDQSKICNYLDIPFQHINDKVLRNMRRGHTSYDAYKLINELKSAIPDIALRTTIMTGFPGETDKEFKELLNFVEEVRFDRLGVFTYSEEENTHAALKYDDDVPNEIKQERMEIIMSVQEKISLKKNQQKVGKIFDVLIDRKEGDNYIGRTEYDSYEVDNEVIIKNNNLQNITGKIKKVKITEASEFDLLGNIV